MQHNGCDWWDGTAAGLKVMKPWYIYLSLERERERENDGYREGKMERERNVRQKKKQRERRKIKSPPAEICVLCTQSSSGVLSVCLWLFLSHSLLNSSGLVELRTMTGRRSFYSNVHLLFKHYQLSQQGKQGECVKTQSGRFVLCSPILTCWQSESEHHGEEFYCSTLSDMKSRARVQHRHTDTCTYWTLLQCLSHSDSVWLKWSPASSQLFSLLLCDWRSN